MTEAIKIKYVLFDLDGVVIDSKKEIEHFWHNWAAKEGLPVDEKSIEQYVHGRTTLETIETLFVHSSDEVKKRIAFEAVEYDRAMRPKLLEGLNDFLEVLNRFEIPVALVTSSPKKRACFFLELHGIHDYFTEIVAMEDVKFGKPHPEPYLRMVQKLNATAASCLVFEDSDSGIKSALDAGMNVIAICNHKYPEVVGVLSDYVSFSFDNDQRKCSVTSLPDLIFEKK